MSRSTDTHVGLVSRRSSTVPCRRNLQVQVSTKVNGREGVKSDSAIGGQS